jgi:hypothetical protein
MDVNGNEYSKKTGISLVHITFNYQSRSFIRHAHLVKHLIDLDRQLSEVLLSPLYEELELKNYP